MHSPPATASPSAPPGKNRATVKGSGGNAWATQPSWFDTQCREAARSCSARFGAEAPADALARSASAT